MRNLLLLLIFTIVPTSECLLQAGDWPNWRGRSQTGFSEEMGLVKEWSKEGVNLAWKQEFVGRSTPVVFDGRVCATGRVGEGILRQEMAACYDALTGQKLWEQRFNVYHSTVPWNRVGWPNPVADPETGYLFVQGVGGLFLCFDREGRIVWQRSLVEDLGFLSGYGGRTQTPVVDEERLIVTFASTSWADLSAPRHRTFAFDKRTGELLWVSSPGRMPADLNSQSTPVMAVIEDQRLLIQGNGDGWIYALQARTGKKVWEFHLSKRAINTSVVVVGTTVFAAHSEENVDEGTMGRVVAFDGRGNGDITSSNELWRTQLAVGFASPAVHENRVYVLDNSANLFVLDAGSGQILWEFSLGTVGKAAPVIADGKLYVTEVNGRFHILELGEDGPTNTHEENLEVASGRYAEIYGSAAVAYGRVYFTTEGGLYCLAGDSAPARTTPSSKEPLVQDSPAGPGAPVAHILVVPNEIVSTPGETIPFRVHGFDAKGKFIGERTASWSLQGLQGDWQSNEFRPAAEAATQVGRVTATVDGISAFARVRVFADLPLTEDFESTEVGSRPDYFMKSLARFEVLEIDGNRVLAKDRSPTGIHKHDLFVGPVYWGGYTIEADLQGTGTRRRIPDMGLINSGYTMDLMGAHQQIQVRSWGSELRMMKEFPFPWEIGVWYRMKLRVDVDADKAVIFGKVWKRDETEPADWTVRVEDPLPIKNGSPGLYGYSPAPMYFDNIRVTKNE